jgi:hypothetical protein
MEYDTTWLLKTTAIIWCSVGIGIGILLSWGAVILKKHFSKPKGCYVELGAGEEKPLPEKYTGA